jgi:hypothetical protein
MLESATAGQRDNTALEAAGEGAYGGGGRNHPFRPHTRRLRLSNLGQVATDGRLDLRAGVAIVQASLDQLLARDDQV